MGLGFYQNHAPKMRRARPSQKWALQLARHAEGRSLVSAGLPTHPLPGPLGAASAMRGAASLGRGALALTSPVVHTARTVSRFLWRLVSTTHMVSWPLRIWDMASSSTSSACWGIFTAYVGQARRR